MRSLLLLVIVCFVCSGVQAQFLDRESASAVCNLPLEVSYGKFAPIAGAMNEAVEIEHPPTQASHKSPFLAAALSLAIPGLGEYYVGDQIWRGAIFTAVDAGLWIGHYSYLARGDDSTAAFQTFADTNWLPQLYADTLNGLLDKTNSAFRISNSNDFAQINKAEDTLSLFVQGIPLSHRLPERGSQQYYELISKYLQFIYGWDDYTGSGSPSPNYLRHADMRANMNHQYEIADYFLFGLIINRVLSAIDAVLLAKDHNSPLRLQGELRTMPARGGTEYVPTAKFRYQF